jgi:hypothetical protein
LDPGWIKIRIRIRDEEPVSYFRELRDNFLGSGIREGKNSDPGFGINIPDPQHCEKPTYFKYMTQYRYPYQTKWLYLDDRVKDLSEVLVGICVTGIDSAVLLTATPK